MTQSDPMKKMFDFLDRLKESRIPFRLDISRARMILVDISLPGQRWEVEFAEDGDIDVEVFESQGVEDVGEERLEELFPEYAHHADGQ